MICDGRLVLASADEVMNKGAALLRSLKLPPLRNRP
jgi:hypothetical protein